MAPRTAEESISVEDKIFAGAIAVLTLHHWLDFAASFSEINRVLRPGCHDLQFSLHFLNKWKITGCVITFLK